MKKDSTVRIRRGQDRQQTTLAGLTPAQEKIYKNPAEKVRESFAIIKQHKKNKKIEKIYTACKECLQALNFLKARNSAAYYTNALELVKSVNDLHQDLQLEQYLDLLLTTASLQFEYSMAILSEFSDQCSKVRELCFNAFATLQSLKGTTKWIVAKRLLNERLQKFHETLKDEAHATADFLEEICIGYHNFYALSEGAADLEDYHRQALCNYAECVLLLVTSWPTDQTYQPVFEIAQQAHEALKPLLITPNRDRGQRCIELSRVLQCNQGRVLCLINMNQHDSAALVYEESKDCEQQLSVALARMNERWGGRLEVEQVQLCWRGAAKYLQAPGCFDFQTAKGKLEIFIAELNRVYEPNYQGNIEDLLVLRGTIEELVRAGFQTANQEEHEELQFLVLMARYLCFYLLDSPVDNPILCSTYLNEISKCLELSDDDADDRESILMLQAEVMAVYLQGGKDGLSMLENVLINMGEARILNRVHYECLSVHMRCQMVSWGTERREDELKNLDDVVINMNFYLQHAQRSSGLIFCRSFFEIDKAFSKMRSYCRTHSQSLKAQGDKNWIHYEEIVEKTLVKLLAALPHLNELCYDVTRMPAKVILKEQLISQLAAVQADLSFAKAANDIGEEERAQATQEIVVLAQQAEDLGNKQAAVAAARSEKQRQKRNEQQWQKLRKQREAKLTLSQNDQTKPILEKTPKFSALFKEHICKVEIQLKEAASFAKDGEPSTKKGYDNEIDKARQNLSAIYSTIEAIHIIRSWVPKNQSEKDKCLEHLEYCGFVLEECKNNLAEVNVKAEQIQQDMEARKERKRAQGLYGQPTSQLKPMNWRTRLCRNLTSLQNNNMAYLQQLEDAMKLKSISENDLQKLEVHLDPDEIEKESALSHVQ